MAPAWRARGIRVLLSDLLWLGDLRATLDRLAHDAAAVIAVQVLAAADVDPPGRGNIRLVDCETDRLKDLFIDAAAEKRYREALARHQENWRNAARQGGAVHAHRQGVARLEPPVRGGAPLSRPCPTAILTATVRALNAPRPANLAPTPILDHEHPRVRAIVDSLAGGAPRPRLYEAHHRIQAAVRPVYALDELQPASVTLAKGYGSCSQRIACLEAVARADGVPTRVRALLMSGRFWYPRFGALSRPCVPRRILLAWPQFHLDGAWTDLDELFGDAASLVSNAREGFTNDGETLFEAIGHTSVDFLGKTTTCGAACDAKFDLSKHVLADEGFFDSRDALFASRLLLQHTLRGRVFEAFWGGRESTRGRQSGAAVLPELIDGGRRCSGG